MNFPNDCEGILERETNPIAIEEIPIDENWFLERENTPEFVEDFGEPVLICNLGDYCFGQQKSLTCNTDDKFYHKTVSYFN